MQKPQTERLGVAAIEYFFAQHGWLFREQFTHDYGIDAHIEIVIDERPTGKLVALQIKSGQSFFTSQTAEAYVFKTNERHVAYWVGHSMPVVLILFDPNTKKAFFQQVNRQTLESTGKGWKLAVPKIDMLEAPDRTLAAFESLTQPEPYIRRLNRLRVDRRWMDLINEGAVVTIEFEQWVNKSLPRYQITISTEDESESWPTLYTPGIDISGMLDHFFPWADVAVDEESHRAGAVDLWHAECYSWYDSETGETYHSQSFDGWYDAPEGLVPVSENGETASYKLVLSLNDFGKSFMVVDDYFADPEADENIGFSLR